MYFPYLRGRQYELLALRELAQGGLLGSHVIPVVEPLKITSTFNSAVKVLRDSVIIRSSAMSILRADSHHEQLLST